MTDDTGSTPDRQPGYERWLRFAGARVPAWLSPHDGEQRWLALVVIVVAIVLQLLLPGRFMVRPQWGPPVLEALLCVVLAVANPGRMIRPLIWLRYLSLTLIGVLAISNTISTILLVNAIVTGVHASAVSILASGGAVWLTNVISYGLLFWEFDRGGPVDRALTPRPTPDFLFAQMTDPRLDPHWRPDFVDYFYLSFTNSTAFSPTDTLPLSRWCELLMLAESAVALVTVSLVAARAVNILPQS